MKTKKCYKCKKEKPLSEFYKNKSKSDGYCSECIDCNRKLSKKYNENNKEKIKKKRKKYYEENKSIILEKNKKLYNRNHKRELTYERLTELLHYNPETGIFTWAKNHGSILKGTVAGSINNTVQGRYIVIDYASYAESRLAWLYMEGYFPEHVVDHKDRNRLNNKWENLRHVTQKCNSRNCTISKNNVSGVNGVSWAKNCGKWSAQIKVDYKKIHLGTFENFNDAVKARWEAEKKYKFTNCDTFSTAYNYLRDNGLI